MATGESGIFLPTREARKFVARCTQATTGAPAIGTVFENTLGGTPAWTRTSAGVYVFTLTGAFPTAKTIVFLSSLNTGGRVFAYANTNANSITITCLDVATPTAADSGNFDIQIIVYP